MRRFLTILCVAAAAVACSRPEYDISEGFNKEITLFGDEISVPLGSIGPLTIGSTLGGLSKVEGIGGVVAEFIQMDDDGNLVMKDSGDIFRINVYELEKRLGDVSQAQTWNAGYQAGSVGGMAAMLGYIGLSPINQKITLYASNPLLVNVPARCAATISGFSSAGFFSAPLEALDNITLEWNQNNVQMLSMNVDNTVTTPISSIAFSNLSMDLPANPVSKISDKKGNLFFAFTYDYSCGIAVGESFNFPVKNTSTGAVNLEIGKYRVKKCRVTAELENTIPLAATFSNMRAIKPRVADEDGNKPDAEVDENIVISADFTIPGGSAEKPGTVTVVLTIEAQQGTIPDIAELMFDINLAAQPDLGAVALNGRQGLFVKSASVKLDGGITIPLE
ncbi:MAG: hypothetical protein J5693_04075 [Bacteroidales bacterium]|nr:hypothetical protein [Bacteroidales bacterium]